MNFVIEHESLICKGLQFARAICSIIIVHRTNARIYREIDFRQISKSVRENEMRVRKRRPNYYVRSLSTACKSLSHSAIDRNDIAKYRHRVFASSSLTFCCVPSPKGAHIERA